jgi:hypothetical protein
MTIEEITQALQRPFDPADIEWRAQRSGKTAKGQWVMMLAYVTNRAIMERLDEVFTPAGWWNQYREMKEGIVCGITCLIDGREVTKWDGAPLTNFEPLKGGLSDAMKRAGYQWGIGRYLYKLDVGFAHEVQKGTRGAIWVSDDKHGVKGYFLPPELPAWAVPKGHTGSQEPAGAVVPPLPDVPAEDPRERVLRLAGEMFDNPRPPEGVAIYDHLNTLKDRVKDRVEDGTINQEDYDKLVLDHYKPALKKHCPDLADTMGQLEQLA